MIDRINGPGGIKGTDKAKAKRKADGPSFDSFLHEAEAATEAAPNEAVASEMGLAGGYIPLEEYPQNPREQARELLKTLRELAGEALGGENPAQTVEKLSQMAEDMDTSQLTEEQKRALEEVKTRAAVEVAKLKG